ncbi:MAG TPA: hypothetical protein VGB64_13135 [Actinomycetota bacterium]
MMKGGPGRPRKRPQAMVREIAPVYGDAAGLLSRLEAAVQTLGNNKVSRILGVSASQPSRWRSGKERPSPAHERAIIELDRVLARLFEDMVAVVALDWLESHNAMLRTRPVDALTRGRFDEVVGAIEVEEQGGYA